jgi:hypothetical protein
MSEKTLLLELSNLKARVATLEAIHKLGPPADQPRHIPSPNEADLTRERDEARNLACGLFQNLRRLSLGADPQGETLQRDYPWLKEVGQLPRP